MRRRLPRQGRPHGPDADALQRQVEELEQRVRELEHELAEAAAGRALGPMDNSSRVIADTVPSPLYVYSLDEGRNVCANSAHQEVIGELSGSGKREEILARVHPDDVGELDASVARIKELADGEHLGRQYRVRLPDGSWRWFSERVAVFRRDETGRVVEFIACTTDVTEQWLTAQALRESEARYRELAEMLPETVFEMDVDYRITFVNLAALEHWGYSRGDYEWGLSVFDLTAPEDRERIRRNIDARFRGATGSHSYTARRKDGTTFPISIYSRPVFANGAPAGVRGIVIDETERMRAEEALRESEERFRAVFESAAVGIALVGPDGHIIDVNEYSVRFFGRPRKQLVGMHFRELTHPEDLEPDQTLYDELAAGRRASYSISKRYLCGRNELLWGELSVSLIRDREGAPMYSIAVVSDITDRHRAEEDRERLLAEVRAFGHRLAAVQEEERRRLARGLHDRVGSSLTVLSLEIGHARNLLSEGADPALCARLDDCLDLVEETGAIVRDVMTDLQPPELEHYGLAAALRSYCERLGARTGLRIRVRGDDAGSRPAPAVEMAFFRIAQEALANVVRHAEASSADVSLEGDGASLAMTIADDGRGFDPARVLAPRRRGWGFTTMRERAESVGASLGWDSTPGRGCAIHVTYREESDDDPGSDRR